MMTIRKTGAASVFAATLLFGALLAAGCSKTDAPAGSGDAAAPGAAVTAPGPAGAADARIAAGKAVFAANNCANCHAIAGSGGRGGPDLTRVGAEAEHTPEYLAAHVKNPQARKPGSRMPKFEGKISEKDLADLGVYLASLK